MSTAILKIPSDRSSAKITSVDEQAVFFEGDENQALRISFCIPPIIGGEVYTYLKGDLMEKNGMMSLTIQDGAGLGNNVEIEFKSGVVHRVSVVWH